MRNVLNNDFRNSYNKREIDSRLRVMYEKEVALQTTSPETYLVVGIQVQNGGSGYTKGQYVTIDDEVVARVTEVTGSGGVLSLWFDDTKVYTKDHETSNPGTTDPDGPDYFRLMSPATGTNYATVTVVTRYAPGEHPRYGDLGHATVHDPLVQASYMIGFVDKKLEGLLAMKFVGYVSQYDPRWPWSATQVGNPNAPVTATKPAGSQDGVEPEAGELWYVSNVVPSVNANTGAIVPESAAPDTLFPWGTSSQTVGKLWRWDGKAWVSHTGYTPKKLDMWETLNVTDATNNAPNTSALSGQNTGFYWLDQWKLYTFSVDETKFVHVKGNESIDGLKTFTTHIEVPKTNNSEKIDTSADADQKRYATKAQVVESALLLSGSNRGSDQTVAGTTKFTGQHTLYGSTSIGSDDGLGAVINLAVKQNVNTRISGGTIMENTVDFRSLDATVKTVTFHDSVKLVVNAETSFSNASSSVSFAKDITVPSKDTVAQQNIKTHPATEHQVWLVQGNLGTHRTAAELDHPEQSVWTKHLKDKAVTGDKIDDETITAANIVDATITNVQIANKTITYNEIANQTITNTQIANKTITVSQIKNNTINGDLIVTGGIPADVLIQPGTITADQLDISSIGENFMPIYGGTFAKDETKNTNAVGKKNAIIVPEGMVLIVPTPSI